MKIVIISAVAENGVIGKANGEMPWHVSEEFKHFKQTTLGFPIIMGRKTFETLGKPLKGRLNIIITRNKNFNYNSEEVKIFNSIDKGIKYCKSIIAEKVFIIGGGEIYKQSIVLADELIISHMKFKAEGSVKFPEITDKEWKLESEEERKEFTVNKYVRVG